VSVIFACRSSRVGSGGAGCSPFFGLPRLRWGLAAAAATGALCGFSRASI